MLSDGVTMRMMVNVIAVLMRMIVRDMANFAFEAAQIEKAENDEHERDTEFQTHADAFGNDDAEQNDRAANNEQREAVTDSPKNSSECGFADLALSADDRRHGDDVIGIGRVAHAEEEAEKQNREQRHKFIFPTSSRA